LPTKTGAANLDEHLLLLHVAVGKVLSLIVMSCHVLAVGHQAAEYFPANGLTAGGGGGYD
jgi:hypothetical protein